MPARRPTSTRTRRPGALLAGALLAATPLLAACQAGLNAETLQIDAAVDGTDFTVGELSVRFLYLDEGRLSAYVYNDGAEDDSLVSVTVGEAAATDVGTDLPAGLLTGLGGDGPAVDVAATGLQDGTTVPVTLTFSSAGAVTLQVPVQIGEERAEREAPPSVEGGE